MRKLVFILLYILVCVRMASAQSGWFELNSGTSNYLNDIVFVGEDTGFVAADYGQLLITFNGGNNWIVRNLVPQPVVYLTSLFFFNSQTGFIASIGKIYKTTDSGFSIDTMNADYQGYLSIHFPSHDTGYAISKYAGIYKSTDAGHNWIELRPSHIGGQMYCIYFVNNETGFIGGSEAPFDFAKTTNGGIDWDSFNFYECVFDIQFSGKYGYAVGTYSIPVIFKTKNYGISWSQININSTSSLWRLSISDSSNVFAIDYSGKLIKSTNGGMNWSVHSTGIPFTTNIYFVNSDTGYIITTQGKIYKTTTGGEPIGVKQLSNEIPEKFILYQNYPNPFNPSTTIKFEIPYEVKSEKSKVKIVVYDVLGKEVDMLLNGKLSPGTYEVNWDATDYPSGVYFYVFSAKGYTNTKKMVVLK